LTLEGFDDPLNGRLKVRSDWLENLSVKFSPPAPVRVIDSSAPKKDISFVSEEDKDFTIITFKNAL